jgi:hypothetical protein
VSAFAVISGFSICAASGINGSQTNFFIDNNYKNGLVNM